MKTGMFRGVLIATLLASSPAFAGEVNGNGKELPLNGRSVCKYSGLNDTPNGLTITLPDGSSLMVDPGGQVQSYGYFMAQKDFLPNPSQPGGKSQFPGESCNPNNGPVSG
jgi:hypothetical protein